MASKNSKMVNTTPACIIFPDLSLRLTDGFGIKFYCLFCNLICLFVLVILKSARMATIKYNIKNPIAI
jgi:hypothetical protein